MCLPELADMACPDVSSDVLANVRPPVSLCEKGISYIEPVVPSVIVGGLYYPGTLSVV